MAVAAVLVYSANASAQFKKFDSTLSMGRVGYRVSCNNKSEDRNEVIIKLYGFDKDARGMDFYLRGKLKGAIIDDLNNDNYPDLILFVNSGPEMEFGSVYAIVSKENKSLIPFTLKDVMLDGKLSPGYKGYDSFSMMEGTLMQKFPIYKPGDEKDKPTGGSRVVQYQVVNDDAGGLKFQVLRSYDVK